MPLPALGAFLASPGGAAAITGVSGILQGIFGGKAKKQEDKRAFEMWSKMQDRRQSMMEGIKPDMPYFGIEKDLPQTHDVAKNMIMKVLQDRMGGMFGGGGGGAGISSELMNAFLQGNQPQAGASGGGGSGRQTTARKMMKNPQEMR